MRQVFEKRVERGPNAGFTSPEADTRAKLGEYVEKFGAMARENNPALYPSARTLGPEAGEHELQIAEVVSA